MHADSNAFLDKLRLQFQELQERVYSEHLKDVSHLEHKIRSLEGENQRLRRPSKGAVEMSPYSSEQTSRRKRSKEQVYAASLSPGVAPGFGGSSRHHRRNKRTPTSKSVRSCAPVGGSERPEGGSGRGTRSSKSHLRHSEAVRKPPESEESVPVPGRIGTNESITEMVLATTPGAVAELRPPGQLQSAVEVTPPTTLPMPGQASRSAGSSEEPGVGGAGFRDASASSSAIKFQGSDVSDRLPTILSLDVRGASAEPAGFAPGPGPGCSAVLEYTSKDGRSQPDDGSREDDPRSPEAQEGKRRRPSNHSAVSRSISDKASSKYTVSIAGGEATEPFAEDAAEDSQRTSELGEESGDGDSLNLTEIESPIHSGESGAELEVDEPKRFALLDCWKQRRFRTSQQSLLHRQQSSQALGNWGASQKSGDAYGAEDEESVPWTRWDTSMHRCIINPSSPGIFSWEILGLLMIVYDFINIPFSLFNPEETAGPDLILIDRVAIWIIRIFWTADIPLAFVTGYVTKTGFVEVRPTAVAKQYGRTRLVLDLVIVGADWLEFIATEFKIITVFRAFRLVRLARASKARKLTEFMLERIRSEKVALSALIIFVVFLLLVLIHICSCLWYGILDGPHKPSGSLEERYTQSYHHVLALFMGESMDPMPQNLGERVFTIIMLVFAFIVSASAVGSLTTAMTRLQIIASERSSQFAKLNRYLSDYRVSRDLTVRVQRNARHALQEQHRKTPESAVSLLRVISEPLRAEIHYEVHSPYLSVHPFFRLYNTINGAGIKNICHLAISLVSLSRGDVLFSEFEVSVARKMFFVCLGKFNYVQTMQDVFQVTQGKWIAEAVLWTTWSHRGTLRATTDCRLIALDASKFSDIMSTFPTPHVFTYAQKYVCGLNIHGWDMQALSDIGEEGPAREIAVSVFAEEGARSSVHSGHQGGRGSFTGVLPMLPDLFAKAPGRNSVNNLGPNGYSVSESPTRLQLFLERLKIFVQKRLAQSTP